MTKKTRAQTHLYVVLLATSWRPSSRPPPNKTLLILSLSNKYKATEPQLVMSCCRSSLHTKLSHILWLWFYWKFGWLGLNWLRLDNGQKHQKGILLQIIYQKWVLLQLFPGGLFFYCKAPPRQASPLCTKHVAQQVAPLTRAPLVAPRGQALLVALLL